ncbi:MAG: carbonic anhydrase [Chlamydiales bacterium]
MDANHALDLLKAGNARFVNEQPSNPRQNIAYRKSQILEQNPFCAVLTCSDSRIPVEILFDQGIGDLFVVRLAGNIASATAIESLDFAVHQFDISLIVVMGHQNCGAVQSVIEGATGQHLEKIGAYISQAVEGKKNTIKAAVIANVDAQLKIVRDRLLIERRLVNQLTICGAYYDFETGYVNFLP